MADVISAPISAERDRMAQDALDYINSRWPNWEAADGDFESWLIQACVRIVAECMEVASDVPPAIVSYLGEWVFDIPRIQAVAAQVNSTWEINSNPAGRTIAAGWTVLIDGVEFEVTNSVALTTGDLATNTGQVVLRAVEPGTGANGLGGDGTFADPLDPVLAWVDTITLEGPTVGGKDEEGDDEYIARVAARARLMGPKPVVPTDFAGLAKDLAAQEGYTIRALGLDLYDPVSNTWDNERYVATAIVDDVTGGLVPGALKTSLTTQLQALRELNFQAPVIDPTITLVHVVCVGKVVTGAIPADVQIEVDAAIEQFLLTLNWGVPDGSTVRGWVNRPKVRHQDLSTVVNNVPDFDYWTTLTFAVGGGGQSTADKDLPGAAPLTSPGTISVTLS